MTVAKKKLSPQVREFAARKWLCLSKLMTSSAEGDDRVGLVLHALQTDALLDFTVDSKTPKHNDVGRDKLSNIVSNNINVESLLFSCP